MSEPLVLVVLFATTPDPTSDTLVSATKTTLGDETVVLADPSASQSEESALSVGERVRSWAVARVSWADSAYLRAKLHVRAANSSEWQDEELRFAPGDAVAERGRTLGYALASMVQRMAHASAPPVADVEGGGARGAELRAPTVAALEDRAGEVRAESAPAPLARLPDGADAPRTSATGQRRDAHLGAIVVGTAALGGGATSAGGKAGLEWWLTGSVGLRVAAGARAGSIPEAQATTTTLLASAGLGYRVPITRALAVGARSDIVLLQHAVRRTVALETSRARWLGAADFLLEAELALTARLALAGAAGAEVAFGTTTVRVMGRELSDLPATRGIAELGVRFRF